MTNKLVIYKKNDKYYFDVVSNLRATSEFFNEKFEPVKVGYKDKFAHFQFNNWEDFRRIRDYLRVNFGLRMFVLNVKAKDKTYQKFFVELMRTPLYSAMLAEREEVNEVSEDEKANIQVYEISSRYDWKEAEKEFGFESDFVNEIFDKETIN